MRLSPATKRRREKAAAANALAAEKAHVELVTQINATLQATNADLRAVLERTEKDRTLYHTLFNERLKEIAPLTQQVQALTTANAEMCGYISRVLEDDAVREEEMADPEEQDNVVHTTFHPRIKRYRTGPAAMNGKWDLASRA